jgi:phage baseplate assembly protein V
MRLVTPLKRTISLLISKALITRTQNDTPNQTQLLQADLGNKQVYDNLERVQPFGLASNPVEGAQAIVLALAGNRDHAVIIQVDDSRYRVQVTNGNVALYNKNGMCIYLKDDEILLSKGLGNTLVPLDGVITGQAIDTFTGMKLGLLPGGNASGTQNSLKLKVAL